MNKKIFVFLCIVVALCFVLTAASYAETAGVKAKKAGQAVVNYTANVVKESVNVVAETGKQGAGVVTDAVKRTGEVVTGDVDKTKELVTEPLTGIADTGVTAVKETVDIPAKAAKGVWPKAVEKK